MLGFKKLNYSRWKILGISLNCCSSIFPIDLATNRIPFGAKSIGKDSKLCNYNQSLVCFNKIQKKISHCDIETEGFLKGQGYYKNKKFLG